MSGEYQNDNGGASADGRAGGHGEAALLLVESLIHGLVARSMLTVADAIGIIDVATDTKAEMLAENGGSPTDIDPSLALLAAMSASLEIDLPPQ